MMKVFLLFALLLWSGPPAGDIEKARELFLAAYESEDKALELWNLTAGAGSDDVVLLGYHGMAKTMMAKYAFNPISKFNYFNKGKKILESAISMAPLNVELRYLRLTIQENAPAILGYSGQINGDRSYIRSKLPGLQDKQLKTMITDYFARKK